LKIHPGELEENKGGDSRTDDEVVLKSLESGVEWISQSKVEVEDDNIIDEHSHTQQSILQVVIDVHHQIEQNQMTFEGVIWRPAQVFLHSLQSSCYQTFEEVELVKDQWKMLGLAYFRVSIVVVEGYTQHQTAPGYHRVRVGLESVRGEEDQANETKEYS
jgi:hypothetical protein